MSTYAYAKEWSLPTNTGYGIPPSTLGLSISKRIVEMRDGRIIRDEAVAVRHRAAEDLLKLDAAKDIEVAV